jgi:hypothetical protein
VACPNGDGKLSSIAATELPPASTAAANAGANAGKELNAAAVAPPPKKRAKAGSARPDALSSEAVATTVTTGSQEDGAATATPEAGCSPGEAAAPTPKGSGGSDAAQPGADEPIAFQQENPKRVGTNGWTRYEKYKTAKTGKEALALGAAKGDLMYDWKKGFFKRVLPS